MNYSDNELTALAQNNPKELVRILNNQNANVRTLTFGIETLGMEVEDEAVVLPAFRVLLKHVNAIVREGTLMGISSFYDKKSPPQDILDRLDFISKNDPSTSLKEDAKYLLEGYLNV